jgi:hypothetical protein
MAQGDVKIVGISDQWFDGDRVLVVVVAVATEGVDWSAYQDAVSTDRFNGLELASMDHDDILSLLIDKARMNGNKISEAEARAYFRNIDLPYRG